MAILTAGQQMIIWSAALVVITALIAWMPAYWDAQRREHALCESRISEERVLATQREQEVVQEALADRQRYASNLAEIQRAMASLQQAMEVVVEEPPAAAPVNNNDRFQIVSTQYN